MKHRIFTEWPKPDKDGVIHFEAGTYILSDPMPEGTKMLRGAGYDEDEDGSRRPKTTLDLGLPMGQGSRKE